jgi:V8-like Glu-specific endopeptidase
VPYKHVPCEYQYVSFFVPENRYCPREDLGERPAAGAALYISWQAAGDRPPQLFFHREDFDGISRTIMQILGSSDDRYAMSEATPLEKAAARSTAVLIGKAYVEDEGGGTVSLRDDPSWPALCSTERFAGLPRPGRCSGVKIGDRLVATSAHCVRNARQCADTSVVFGYYGEGDTRAVAKSDDVYQCTSIVASRRPAAIGERGADWTIFEVDRDIDAPSATLADSANVHPSVVTTVIGYPLGLAAIVTRLGVVQTAATEYFIANSDTFIGNSGSAVFAAQSIEDSAPLVLGLLTGGRYDFVDSREGGAECVQAKWCRDADCLGDDVVYTDDLIRALSAHTPQQ